MGFEISPVSIWEKDLSGVSALFEHLRQEGVTDIEAYFAQHPEAIRECARRTRIVAVSRAALAPRSGSGSSKEELFAAQGDATGPESLDMLRQELVCLWNGGTELTEDAVVATRAGDSRHVTISLSVCPGHEATLSKVFVSLTDTTERRRAEEALRESEERLGESARIAHVGYWDRDLVAGTITLSAEACRIFGLPLDYRCPKLSEWHVQWKKLIHPDDAPRTARAVSVAMAGGPRYDVGYRVVRPDGEVRLVHSYADITRDASGKPTRMFGTMIDITERRHAEERLSRQAALLDAASDAIHVRTLDHTITYWNAGAEQVYGWSRAEALGRKITDLGEMDRAAFDRAHAALLVQGSWSGEMTRTTKAGRKLIVFVRWTLLRDEQGQPSEVLAIHTDITEKKQLESNFLRAQRMEALGVLAGGLAHDLNNILTPIVMAAPLLREGLADPRDAMLADTVESCALRGADIIKQLLTFARGSPGSRAPLPLRQILREMEKLIRETFPRNIQVFVRVPPDLWLTMGDTTQVHQAIMNLCVNARDAMLDGGSLILEARNLKLDEGAASTAPDERPGTYVSIRVTDSGMGIPPEHLDLIFDPFFTTKEIGRGTGLGLASVAGIVRGHGGFVRVDSEVGRGSTFELCFPASPEMNAPSSSDQERRPPQGRGELILVVDDEPSVRGVVKRILEEHGYRVLTAEEGNKALALLAGHRSEIKAVLTDLMMPGLDGPKLSRALKRLDPRLPVLGMTGLVGREDAQHPEDLHLRALLTKPFAAADLLVAMREALDSASQRRNT